MRYELTIPAGTAIEHPLSVFAQYTGAINGRINGWTLRIPKGHAYLTGFQMVVGRSGVVIPGQSSNVAWVRGDGEIVQGALGIQLDPPQYSLELRGYNLSLWYPHTFYLDLE